MKRSFKHVRTTFFTGLAVVLPAIISVAVLLWLFGTVSNLTDKILFFFPIDWVKVKATNGEMILRWYSSYLALAVSFIVILLIGRLTRIYVGRKLIFFFEQVILNVPLLNRIYSTIKQVNDAFATNSKSNFKQVVIIEFPKPGVYALGFLTAEQNQEVGAMLGEGVVSVFVPTTPNPTSGYLAIVPLASVRKLKMSVADGIKFIISLGTVSPSFSHSIDSSAGQAVALSPEAAEKLA